MNDKDIELLEESFKKFYFDNFNLIHVPENPSQREFGFQKFNSKMSRHLSLKSDKELRLLLMEKIPSDVYCSNACYSFPNLPMNEKDWKNAELIFDIDAKDLDVSNRDKHSCVKCTECNEVALFQQSCPTCKSKKLSKITLSCNDCIIAAKDQVKRLEHILVNDFAINQNSIQVFFSGNEGFHIYVNNSEFQIVGAKERAEIVDYIMFRGVIPETFGLPKKFNNKNTSLPDFGELGWRGRLATKLFSPKSKRPQISKKIISSGYAAFQKQLDLIKNEIGVRIDPNVTVDIHRIFRLPGSLNSKSGLAKIHVNDIDNFDPYLDACFIDGDDVEVIANCPIQFSLKNKKFGPYNHETISVPKYAAVYMICKGIANHT